MSLESDVHDVQQFIAELRDLKTLENVGHALESALASIKEAKGAEARRDRAEAAAKKASDDLAILSAAVDAGRKSNESDLTIAKLAAEDIRVRAREKGNTIIAKAQASADTLLSEAQTKAVKLSASNEAQTERLGMLAAQIDHGESKLNEIRAAIAKITGV